MERLSDKRGKKWILAAGRYAKREVDAAECPECGHALRLVYTPDVHGSIVSLAIICDSCSLYTVVTSAQKPDWME